MSQRRRLALLTATALAVVGTAAGWTIARDHEPLADDPLDPARWDCRSLAILAAVREVEKDPSRCTPVFNPPRSRSGDVSYLAYFYPWLVPGAFSPPVGRDPWGRPFRVLCHGKVTRLESMGPDGRRDSEDDVAVICRRSDRDTLEDAPGRLDVSRFSGTWLDRQHEEGATRCATPDHTPEVSPESYTHDWTLDDW